MSVTETPEEKAKRLRWAANDKAAAIYFLLGAIFGTLPLYPLQWICVGIGISKLDKDQRTWMHWASLYGPIGSVFSWLVYCDLADKSGYLKWGVVGGEVLVILIVLYVMFGSKIRMAWKAKKAYNKGKHIKNQAMGYANMAVSITGGSSLMDVMQPMGYTNMTSGYYGPQPQSYYQ